MKRREFLTSSLAAGVALGFPALVSARSPNARVYRDGWTLAGL